MASLPQEEQVRSMQRALELTRLISEQK